MLSIIPRDTEFFDLFEKGGTILVNAGEAYYNAARNYDQRESFIGRIRQFEHEGDEITHRTLGKLDTSFVVPFDREDIQELIRGMDDVIDEIDAAAKRLTLYEIQEPTPWLIKQTDVLLKACKLVASSLAKLRRIKKPNGLHDSLVEIHRLENDGDDNNHAAVAELLRTSTDAIHVIKWKEIYDFTERAIDGCEDVAVTIERIVIKNT